MLMRLFTGAMIACIAVVMIGIAMLAAVDVGKTTAQPISIRTGHTR